MINAHLLAIDEMASQVGGGIGGQIAKQGNPSTGPARLAPSQEERGGIEGEGSEV